MRIGDVEYGEVAFGFMRRLHDAGTDQAKQEAMIVHEFHRVFPGVEMKRTERDYDAPPAQIVGADQTNMFENPGGGDAAPASGSALAGTSPGASSGPDQPPRTDPSSAAPALEEKPVLNMTDAEFLLYLLGDGEWWMLSDILERSQLERGCGLTVHSRAADLRRNGYLIENTQSKNERDRTDSFYRLAGRTP